MQYKWSNTGCAVVANPKSGTRTVRFPQGNIIYNETPRTPVGNHRFLAVGTEGAYVCDIDTLSYTLVEEQSRGFYTGINTSYSDSVYFERAPAKPGAPTEVYRLSLVTLERERVLSIAGLPRLGDGAFAGVSPKHDFLIYLTRGPGISQLIRVNIPDGKWQVIVEEPDPLTHIQVEPTTGGLVFIQQNRGGKVDEKGAYTLLVGEEGCTHTMARTDGLARHVLPVGPPHTLTCGGHSAWIGGSNRVILQVHWNHNEFNKPGLPADWSFDSRWPGASLFTAGPGDTKPTPIVTPDQRFYHVSSSRCGRYYIGDTVPTRMGPTDIVIGNVATGKYRTFLHDCLCYYGSCWPCSLPYFTADLKYVVYREKKDASLPKYQGFEIYASELPKEFLASMD